MVESEVPTVVIDNGSGMCKVGIGSENDPTAVFPTIVGRPGKTPVFGPDRKETLFIGNDALPKAAGAASTMYLTHPIERGMITNWDDMEKIWHHCFFNELKVAPEEHSCLLTEAPLTPKANREKMTELMFDKFNFKNFYVITSAALSLQATARTTGIAVDIGDGVGHIIPIYEGSPLSHGINRFDLAGRDITEYLGKLMAETGNNFDASQRETVQDIKEKTCFVALDFDKVKKEAEQSAIHDINYKLPDGNTCVVRSQRFRAAETLFQPSLIGKELPGIHELAFDSVMKCDVDLRRELFKNVCLLGGTTMIPGFPERLIKELVSRVPSTMKVKAIAPSQRMLVAWIGGSVLASLSVFETMLISKKEYEEAGASVVHRKCL